jgi:hypothetical protein
MIVKISEIYSITIRQDNVIELSNIRLQLSIFLIKACTCSYYDLLSGALESRICRHLSKKRSV